MAKLIVRYQNQTVGEHALQAGFNDIGRLPACPIRIDNPGISRQHAFILGDREGKIFIVEDLQSLNGTYVNKRRAQKHLLRSGDVLTLGQHTLEFVEEAAPPVAAADEAPAGKDPSLEEIPSGRRHALIKDTVYFGNSSSDDIHIPGLMVGKNFASLNRKGTAWVVSLLVKRFSELRLNGEEIRSSQLEDGDTLEVAGVKFVFRLPSAPA
jgi:pSer/pThr/pTyr-binding forkhead associated (FHA) protein